MTARNDCSVYDVLTWYTFSYITQETNNQTNKQHGALHQYNSAHRPTQFNLTFHYNSSLSVFCRSVSTSSILIPLQYKISPSVCHHSLRSHNNISGPEHNVFLINSQMAYLPNDARNSPNPLGKNATNKFLFKFKIRVICFNHFLKFLPHLHNRYTAVFPDQNPI